MKSLLLSLLFFGSLAQIHSSFANNTVSLSTDSIREVNIRVTVKEIAVNYDSIFNARLTEVTPTNDKDDYSIKVETSKKLKINSVTQAVKIAPSLQPVDENLSSPDIENVNRTIEKINRSKKNNKASTTIPDSLNPETGAFSMAPLNDTVQQKNAIPENTKATSNYSVLQVKGHKLIYLSLGAILMLFGVIGGLVFNKKAFLISGVGILFLLIGLYV